MVEQYSCKEDIFEDMSDEELKDIYEDMEADRIISEQKEEVYYEP